jgi:nucleoid-associated protein YgaU
MDSAPARLNVWRVLILLAAWGMAQALSACSANPMAEDEVQADEFGDVSVAPAEPGSGDEFGAEAFGEDPPIPAPESLPEEAATLSEDLAGSRTVAELSQAAEEDPATAAFAAAQSQLDARKPDGAQQVAAAGTVTVRRPRRRYRSEPVAVRSRPFESGGSLLNGFYFTRAEDQSWVDLAQKLYGDPAKAEDLRLWNGGSSLRVGTLIYYSSPFRPQDAEQMKSFSQDYGLGTEGYAIQRGDTLSRIAAFRYGGAQSWKEIAAENPELRSPDRIDPGMRIQLPPARIATLAALEQAASGTRRKGVEPAPQPEPIPKPVTTAAVPAVPERAPSNSMPAASEASPLNGLRLSPEVLTGALAVLLIGAFLLRRREA